MKRFRPYCSGYIVLYVLIALSLADAGYTLFCQIRGSSNYYVSNFSLFTYLIAAMGVAYGQLYARAQVCIDDKNLRIAFPANIQPPESGKRAMILFRSGSTDMKLIDKTFALAKIERYGYVEDLGFSRVDKSSSDEKSPLFKVHEVCFLTSDSKRYHMNAGIYSKKQLKEIFTLIKDATGIAPEGKLAEVLQ